MVGGGCLVPGAPGAWCLERLVPGAPGAWCLESNVWNPVYNIMHVYRKSKQKMHYTDTKTTHYNVIIIHFISNRITLQLY